MPTCAVQICKNRYKPGRKFYRFPKIWKNSYLKDLSEQRQKAWYKALRLDESNDPKYIVVCQDHFISGKCANIKESDHPDWVPSQNMGYVSINKPSATSLSRFERAKNKLSRLKTKSIIVPVENPGHCNTNLQSHKSSTCHTYVSEEFHTTDHDSNEYPLNPNTYSNEYQLNPNTKYGGVTVFSDVQDVQATENISENVFFSTTEIKDTHLCNSIVQHSTISQRSVETQTVITMKQMDRDKVAVEDLQTEINNLKEIILRKVVKSIVPIGNLSTMMTKKRKNDCR